MKTMRTVTRDMNFVEPKVEIITETDLYKRIEIGARVCYKSEDKTTDGSAEKMVKALIRRGHMSPLEHSNIVMSAPLRADYEYMNVLIDLYERGTGLPSYLRRDNETAFISGNYRAWLNFFGHFKDAGLFYGILKDAPEFASVMPTDDNHTFPDVAFINPYNPYLPDRHSIITARFTCDRGVTHELVRSRCLSFSQESTRYVTYGDNNFAFIQPHWWKDSTDMESAENVVESAAFEAKRVYMTLLNEYGFKPQDARAVLPNMLKTEIVTTGTVEQWKKYVLPLRLSKAAHPDIRRLMELFCSALGWDPEEFR